MPVPVVAVTGTSKGIGLAIVEILLVKHKANVVSLSRSRTPALDKLGREHASALDIVECDITDEAATSAALATAQKKYGRLDALVLNAAKLMLGRIDSPGSTVDTWKDIFDVNFFSLLHTVRAALPQLRASNGKIIFVSSSASTGGTAAWGAYNASKAAMNSFCRTLASEEPDITCIALHPGLVNTGMQVDIRAEGGAHMVPDDHAHFINQHATGKLLKPTDPGSVITALALNATKDLSGKYFLWNEAELLPYRE